MADLSTPRPSPQRPALEAAGPCAAALNPCQQDLLAWSAARTGHSSWLASGQGVAVAYSAGADSTALLLSAHSLWPGRVCALHVNHGLQQAAAEFEAHARQVCAYHGIALHVSHVQAAAPAGQSPEAVARDRRYEALARMAQEAQVQAVWLAQHADDQAETLLLALSRGAGVPGLAAMGARFERHGVRFERPLLSLTASQVRHWLGAAGHPFVQDPSNADTRYTRNRIRALLMPAWVACFPGFAAVLARSARHAAQAQSLLDDLARIDMVSVQTPPLIAAVRALSAERQANALRYWLRTSHHVAPSTAQLEQLLDQLSHCRTRAHRIDLKIAQGFVTRAGERLVYTPSI